MDENVHRLNDWQSLGTASVQTDFLMTNVIDNRPGMSRVGVCSGA